MPAEASGRAGWQAGGVAGSERSGRLAKQRGGSCAGLCTASCEPHPRSLPPSASPQDRVGTLEVGKEFDALLIDGGSSAAYDTFPSVTPARADAVSGGGRPSWVVLL